MMPEDGYAPMAELYDLAYGDFDEDVDLFTNLGNAAEGPVLELGVGSGRVAIPLVERSFEVVGIDSSHSMLARAAKNLANADLRDAGSLELLAADMRDFDLKRRFGMVIIAADTFQHLLSTEDQVACLSCVVRHLEPGGIFCFSVRSPASVDWGDENGGPLLLDWTRTDPGSAEHVMKLISGRADVASQVKHWTYVYDRVAATGALSRVVFEIDLRYTSQSELTLLLQQVGLRVTHVYGDYDLSPVGQGDNLVFVAQTEEHP